MCIKILQLRLAKPVQTHTKLSSIPVPVIPVSSKPVSEKTANSNSKAILAR